MTSNTSNADRGIRLVVAVAALLGAWLVGFGSILGIILVIVAVAMVVTAAVGWCPIYRVFGISTRKVPQSKQVPVKQ